MISGKVDISIAVKMVRDADKRINTAAFVAVGVMAHSAMLYCKQMVSQVGDDHSLRDLARMGHPYGKGDLSRDVGQTRVSVAREPIPHSPWEQIHSRAGDIVRGLIATRPQAHHGYIEASVYNATQPLDTWLQLGTEKMIGRPYMKYVKKHFGREIQDSGKRAFRAFGPGVVRRVA